VGQDKFLSILWTLFNQNHTSLASKTKNFATICQNSNLILLVLRVMILNFKQFSVKDLVHNILMEAPTFASLKLIMKFMHMTLIKMCHINWIKKKERWNSQRRRNTEEKNESWTTKEAQSLKKSKQFNMTSSARLLGIMATNSILSEKEKMEWSVSIRKRKDIPSELWRKGLYTSRKMCDL